MYIAVVCCSCCSLRRCCCYCCGFCCCCCGCCYWCCCSTSASGSSTVYQIEEPICIHHSRRYCSRADGHPGRRGRSRRTGSRRYPSHYCRRYRRRVQLRVCSRRGAAREGQGLPGPFAPRGVYQVSVSGERTLLGGWGLGGKGGFVEEAAVLSTLFTLFRPMRLLNRSITCVY